MIQLVSGSSVFSLSFKAIDFYSRCNQKHYINDKVGVCAHQMDSIIPMCYCAKSFVSLFLGFCSNSHVIKFISDVALPLSLTVTNVMIMLYYVSQYMVEVRLSSNVLQYTRLH